MKLLTVATLPSLLFVVFPGFLLGVPSAARPASYTSTTIDVPGAVMNAVMTLPARIVGVDYGPFRDGQSPNTGVFSSSQQLNDDMPVLKVIADAIRTYSTTNGFENIAGFAEQQGLKIAPGAWLSDNAKTNALETDNLITLTQQHDNVLFAVVGSEAILRFENKRPEGLSKNAVIVQINRVKQNASVPVTTSEPWHIWRDNPDLVDAVDLIFLNINPYWGKQHIDNASSRRYGSYISRLEKSFLRLTDWVRRLTIQKDGSFCNDAFHSHHRTDIHKCKRFISPSPLVGGVGYFFVPWFRRRT